MYDFIAIVGYREIFAQQIFFLEIIILKYEIFKYLFHISTRYANNLSKI